MTTLGTIPRMKEKRKYTDKQLPLDDSLLLLINYQFIVEISISHRYLLSVCIIGSSLYIRWNPHRPILIYDGHPIERCGPQISLSISHVQSSQRGMSIFIQYRFTLFQLQWNGGGGRRRARIPLYIPAAQHLTHTQTVELALLYKPFIASRLFLSSVRISFRVVYINKTSVPNV